MSKTSKSTVLGVIFGLVVGCPIAIGLCMLVLPNSWEPAEIGLVFGLLMVPVWALVFRSSSEEDERRSLMGW